MIFNNPKSQNQIWHIGKQGKMANAIRAILKVASGKGGKKFIIEVVE
jgi:predicted RNA-binding protein YlqC (UPF0109 family)